MGRSLEPDYETSLLLPPCLEDWVGPRHPARFVREFVGALDLGSLGFKVEVAKTGRPGYAPGVLLSAWLYGYLSKRKSTRDLERLCRSDMGAIWLTGNLQPDHNTLWTFFKLNRERFKAVLAQTTLLACRMGLVDLNFVAIDGTKSRASASDADAVRAKDLAWALDALTQEAERYLSEVESAGPGESFSLPEEYADREKLRKSIAEDLEILKAMGTSVHSPVDPDARPMKTSEGTKLAYNVQAAVDSASGIVLACEAVQDASDSSRLNFMLDAVEAAVGLRPDLTCVDSGYFAADEIALAEEKARNVVVGTRGRSPGEDPFHAWHFERETEENVLRCLFGGTLTYRGRGKTHGGADVVDRYRCADHLFCPFASLCSASPKGRVVEVGPHRERAIALWRRQRENWEQTSKAMKKRGATVERVFGHVKRNLGLGRLEHRGLPGVNAVWALALCATNLVTLYKVWEAGG